MSKATCLCVHLCYVAVDLFPFFFVFYTHILQKSARNRQRWKANVPDFRKSQLEVGMQKLEYRVTCDPWTAGQMSRTRCTPAAQTTDLREAVLWANLIAKVTAPQGAETTARRHQPMMVNSPGKFEPKTLKRKGNQRSKYQEAVKKLFKVPRVVTYHQVPWVLLAYTKSMRRKF